jgi:hypothetical protein
MSFITTTLYYCLTTSSKYDCHLIIIVVNSNLHEVDAYRFHWILLIISIDNSNINIYDSLRKDPSEYKTFKMYSTNNNSIYDIFFNAIYIFSFYTNILYLLLFCLRAWTMFTAKHQGTFQPKIRWVTNFPVRI